MKFESKFVELEDCPSSATSGSERFAQRHNLHAVALPIDDVPPIETHLFWHESTDQDPANRWMREQIIELSQKLVRDYQKSKDAAAS